MKIGFSCFVLDGGQSGIATYILGLLQALQKIDRENSYDLFVSKRESNLIELEKKNFILNIRSSFWDHSIPSIFWHNCVLPLVSKNYDLIHIPTIRRIPWIKPSKLIATIHDMGPLVLKNKYGHLRSLYHRYFLSQWIRNCDRIIAVSQTTKREIVQFTNYPEEKIDVIYSGLDSFWKEEVLPIRIDHIQKPFFVYVSRIEHPAKNHVRLIEAFELFKRRTGAPHQLIFAGADWIGSHLVHQAIRKSPCQKEILALGYVHRETVRALYHQCDLMIFPSLYEGFGFPVLEALASGAKVACSNIPSLNEIAHGYAEFFDPYNVDEIAKSLEISHLSERSEAGKKYACSFTWENTAKQTMDVYKKVHH